MTVTDVEAMLLALPEVRSELALAGIHHPEVTA